MIACADLDGINEILGMKPHLANEPIPVNAHNPAMAHPLHRICDGVFEGIYTDLDGAAIARVFLRHGAHVNGNDIREKADTPLIAAASLRADEVALLFIDSGAAINHAGTHGGTALHWGAWCGRDRVVKKLLETKAEMDLRCIDFTATPLVWAIHGYKFGGIENRHRQVECVRLLCQAGADRDIPNGKGTRPVDMLDAGDRDLRDILTAK